MFQEITLILWDHFQYGRLVLPTLKNELYNFVYFPNIKVNVSSINHHEYFNNFLGFSICICF